MNKIKWLRISYWLAAIADFIIAILVQIPLLVGTEKYVFPMGIVSAITISWGIMLLIADRKPVERMWILVPTMLVVFLLGLASLHALVMNITPLYLSISSVIASIIVFLILFISYTNAKKV